MPPFTWLALGDSYTIGEGVPFYETYPCQTVQRLRSNGNQVTAPEILARTGWTSGELIEQMKQYHFLPQYDLVTILIGVNNQYRGQSPDDYATDFQWLVKKAAVLGKKTIVLSIPDWGVTPFAEGKNREKVGKEIDVFNAINMGIAEENAIPYVDISVIYRKSGDSMVAGDGLHPSGAMYTLWSEELLKVF